MAITITSTADKEVTVILADAEKQSQILKGEETDKEIKSLPTLLVKIQNFLLFTELCRRMKQL